MNISKIWNSGDFRPNFWKWGSLGPIATILVTDKYFWYVGSMWLKHPVYISCLPSYMAACIMHMSTFLYCLHAYMCAWLHLVMPACLYICMSKCLPAFMAACIMHICLPKGLLVGQTDRLTPKWKQRDLFQEDRQTPTWKHREPFLDIHTYTKLKTEEPLSWQTHTKMKTGEAFVWY